MDKIIIFKTDKLGDLINFSPCLKIIKDNNKDYHITLICSDFNFQVAKNYPYVDEILILDKKNLFKNIINNFRKLFLTKYKYLFQFDGKGSSYTISYFIKSKIKSTICFIKHKKIIGINYSSFRPSKYLLKIFYNNFIFCDENYANNDKDKTLVHYQSNYFTILEKLNFKITDKRNLFSLDKSYQNKYDDFYKKFIQKQFCLFHFDEKWNRLKLADYANSLKIIDRLSKKFDVVVTTGVKNFNFLNDLKKKFCNINYAQNEFMSVDPVSKNNIFLLEGLPLNLLAYFIKNSQINFSFHSGPVVHISPTFDRQIVDLIPKSKNDELDRWIPTVSKYRRINFEDLNDEIIENI